MKNVIILFTFFLIAQQKIQSQTPSWSWVRASQATYLARAENICADNFGNIYVTGSYRDALVFAGDTLNTPFDPFTSLNFDIYLAKYDSSGNEKWARRAGSYFDDYGYAVATDNNGNVYIAGQYADTARFDTVLLTSHGSGDLFLAKYDSSGNFQWVRSTTNGTAIGYGIGFDSFNNCYLTGTFTNHFAYDSVLVQGHGNYDIFICKINDAGNIIWVKIAGGTGADKSYDIDVDPIGNCLITGYYSDTSYFNSTGIVSKGYSDGFVAKYDSGGIFKWVKSFGGSLSDFGDDIVSDASGNVYFTGSFKDTASIGSVHLISKGSLDMLVAKLDINGNCIWARSGGSTLEDQGSGIAVDQNGNVMVTGSFKGTMIISVDTLITNIEDIYVANFDLNGNINWSKQAGALSSFDDGLAVCKNNAGDFYFGGSINDNAYFDSLYVILNYPNSFYLARLGHFDIIAGLESVANNFDFEIYPNPTTSILTISILNQERNEKHLISDLNLTVCDMTGRIFFSEEISDKHYIDLSQLKEGMYLISICDGNRCLKRKIVKL